MVSMKFKCQAQILLGNITRYLGVAIVLIKNLDYLFRLSLNPHKERFPIHHSRHNLTEPLGWPNGNDVSSN